MPALRRPAALMEWHTPLACVLVILLSSLYTSHVHHQTLGPHHRLLLEELASMQIAGVIIAFAAASALRRATGDPPKSPAHLQHPMLPPAAARRRQMLPLV